MDTLEMAFCPATGRLTMTVATDMLVQNGGPTVQAVRMWVKQGTFTAAQGRHAATAGCTVGTAFDLSGHHHLISIGSQAASLHADLSCLKQEGIPGINHGHLRQLAATLAMTYTA